MMESIDREYKIVRSGVRDVFTPNKPVDSIGLFCGRSNEVARIVESVNTDGLHVLLYGDRGVGKTSLARITGEILTKSGVVEKCYIKRCDRSDTFRTIVMHFLDSVGIKCAIKESIGVSGTIGFKDCGFGQTSTKEMLNIDNIDSPSWVASKIEHIKGLFLIDEFDVLKDDEDKKKIAELIKQLSDANSKLTIFVVGISKTARELIAGHPSVQRCVKEIHLKRMYDHELTAIIENGENRLQMTFAKDVKKRIVQISAGFPYFTHLLALKTAEEAIVIDKTTISKDDFRRAVTRSVDDLEGSLRDKYNSAINGNKKERNTNILLAAALCGEDIFRAQDLKLNYNTITKQNISQQELNNFLTPNIISEGYTTILQRVGKGLYRFNDPRMPSYIKLVNNYMEE
ncbi:MAG: ATP-binding protein [Alistipes sp.]|nr:ATP-binding protein [Alistipes sp.]